MNNTALKIYNSITGKKEIFKPIDSPNVNLYVCGMTVYDFNHMGHGRMMFAFDMVVRYLRYQGYKVTYVQNITDIDDKIIRRANEKNIPYQELTQTFINALMEDRKVLGLVPPDKEPRATDYIDRMQTIIQTLIDKKMAYVSSSGDVLYDVNSFDGYGKLSHRTLASMQAGARIEVDATKKNPLDFVLWKMSKPDEPSWDSPWGKGRPGWHIECSAMATECLAETIDIHGGGIDLKFPHHENEIAQTEACTCKPFANLWMHSGFLQINNEKMSKSLGNFFLIRDVLEKYSPEQLRLFMLSTHYRQPINYSEENLNHTKESLNRLYQCMRDVELTDPLQGSDYEQRFIDAMNDDFNTPEALTVLFDLVRFVNRLKEEHSDALSAHVALLKTLGQVLGLYMQTPEEYFKGSVDDVGAIDALIQQRNEARKNKDWATADSVRAKLDAMGIILEDTPAGTSWKKV